MKYFVSSLALITLLLAGCKPSEKKEEAIKPVKYAEIVYARGSRTNTFSGIVKAQSETNLSFKVGGTLSQVNVKMGDRVRKGQLISAIDPVDYNLQKEQALAQKNSAEAQLLSARSTFERIEKLYEMNSVSLSDFENAKTNLDAAISQLAAAESQLEAANNQVNYTKLYAPTDGVVSEVNITVNEVVQAGRTVMVISSEDENNMEVEVDIPERYIKDVQNGDEVKIRISSIDDNFRGTVTEVAYSSSGTGVTYPVSISLNSKSNKTIRPDMPAEVTFSFGKSNEESGLVAPLKAIASGVDGNYAFRLVADTLDGIFVAEKVTIELGTITEDGYIINEGLSVGDLVAVAGLSSLYDGRKVKLLEE